MDEWETKMRQQKNITGEFFGRFFFGFRSVHPAS